MQFCLNFQAFQKALVESFPERKNTIRRAFEEFDHQMEAARKELGPSDDAAKVGQARSSAQQDEKSHRKVKEGKMLPSISEATLGHERGKSFLRPTSSTHRSKKRFRLHGP